MRKCHGSRAVRAALWTVSLALAATGCGTDQAPLGPTETAKRTPAGFPSHDRLRDALEAVVATSNGGFGLEMWATLVDRTGTVVDVAYSGDDVAAQWPGSRVISAQKANTANAFSLTGLALSTANLYTAVQPGGTLFGLQESNPVNADIAYRGKAGDWGTTKDYLIGKRIGGVNVFGGGLALYAPSGELLGGLGVSGDSSCADHNIAWKLRYALGLDNVPAGVSATGDDNIVYDITTDATGHAVSASGWGHPECAPAATAIARALPTTHPTS